MDLTLLPTEVLLKIFSYISCPEILLIKATCKRWYKILCDNDYLSQRISGHYKILSRQKRKSCCISPLESGPCDAKYCTRVSIKWPSKREIWYSLDLMRKGYSLDKDLEEQINFTHVWNTSKTYLRRPENHPPIANISELRFIMTIINSQYETPIKNLTIRSIVFDTNSNSEDLSNLISSAYIKNICIIGNSGKETSSMWCQCTTPCVCLSEISSTFVENISCQGVIFCNICNTVHRKSASQNAQNSVGRKMVKCQMLGGIKLCV